MDNANTLRELIGCDTIIIRTVLGNPISVIIRGDEISTSSAIGTMAIKHCWQEMKPEASYKTAGEVWHYYILT